jgi:hypothetical protein
MIEKQTEKKVKLLRTDNDMEFCSNEFNDYCSDEGIVRHHTIPYTPQQNGVAEHMNITIISKAHCILSNAGMSRRFWPEEASTACYLINRSPYIPLDKKTLIEVWSGTPTDYSHLRVFGCIAYAHVDNGKLEARAIKCIFLGYISGVKAYKLWNPETKRILMSRNVVFNEAVMFTNNQISADSDVSDIFDDGQQRTSVQLEHVEEKENDTAENNDVDHEPEFDDIDNGFVPLSPPVSQQQSHSIAANLPRRNIAPRKRLIEECNIVHYAMSCAESATYIEVIASIDREKWISSMQEEMQSLDKNSTSDVVRLRKHKKVVHCEWIFKRKEGLSPKEPARFKARLVAKGRFQSDSMY